MNGRSQILVTGLLVFGAIVFGMVIAGSLELTAPTLGSPVESSDSTGQRVAAHASSSIQSFADLAEAVIPAVVSVRSTNIEQADQRGRVDPFQFFFRRFPQNEDGEEQREFRSDGAGSGFVISSDGWIVTNYHVVEEAEKVQVTLNSREYEAEVRGQDPSTDIALLKVDAGDQLTYLALGDSERLRVGDWVMAVGNPLALESTVTVGVVSAKGRSIGLIDVSFENFIQTDAAINRGNSGGPLVNTSGEVIGISTAMNFGAENIGFAVPVDTLKQVLPQLREHGRVRRGYLGVNISNLDFEAKEAFGLASTDGALVTQVQEDSPAEEAGLRPGDVILEVDQHHVKETRDLIDYVAAKPPGAKVELELMRGDKRIDRSVELGERDADQQVAEVEPEDGDRTLDWLGIDFRTLDRELRGAHSFPRGIEGVMITDVSPRSPLYEEGVRPGDVISEVNGTAVSDAGDFEEQVEATEAGQYLRLYIQRAGGAFFAIVRVP